MKIKITKSQILNIIAMADDMEAMLGNGEDGPDKAWKRYIRSVDAMLKNNGYKRVRGSLVKLPPAAEAKYGPENPCPRCGKREKFCQCG